jgi:hypothetical protein
VGGALRWWATIKREAFVVVFRGLSSKLFLLTVALSAIVLVPSSSAHEPTPAPAETCAEAPCFVSVMKLGSGGGLVTSEPAGVHCGTTCMVATDEGASMVVVATPDPGSVVTAWAGDCNPLVGNRCHLRFDTAKELTVVFDLIGAPSTPLPSGGVGPPAGGATADHPPLGSRCTIVGTAGPNVLRGTSGRDVICGKGGNDTIYGGAGHDLILGGYGNDRLYGQGGRDHLVGGPGHDVLAGGRLDDELFGATGADLLLARDGVTDLVFGGSGRDRARVDGVDALRSIERRF